MLLNHMKAHHFSCGNLFLKNDSTLEFIFEEKSLFETFENKTLQK